MNYLNIYDAVIPENSIIYDSIIPENSIIYVEVENEDQYWNNNEDEFEFESEFDINKNIEPFSKYPSAKSSSSYNKHTKNIWNKQAFIPIFSTSYPHFCNWLIINDLHIKGFLGDLRGYNKKGREIPYLTILTPTTHLKIVPIGFLLTHPIPNLG